MKRFLPAPRRRGARRRSGGVGTAVGPADAPGGQAHRRVRRPGSRLRLGHRPRQHRHQSARLRGRSRRRRRQEARAHARCGCTRRGTASSRPARRSSTSRSRRRRSPRSGRRRSTSPTSYLNANQGVLLSKQAPVAAQPRRPEEACRLCAQTNTTGLDWINTQLHPTKKPLRVSRRRRPRIRRCRSTAARR